MVGFETEVLFHRKIT